ncbi:hypothetical protein FSP39_015907 [Pinctada imbricata]|uniref:Major facilitator superfamily associated domain-containing protein n=1 Tax=Pinctada imbricata TaxID=66713 RepID=A0AA89BPV7_PINIB|nr:hypothetical protein FSP39_015907 [Pinctada imbricata]
MPVEVTEPVNLTRSILICNIFNFLFAASKSCLMPFLTLYLRMLGLTATQTGIVIGAKTFSAFLFAPFWSKCATSCRKRKFVLVFSLFMMAATYLSLTLIPSVHHNVGACRSSGQGQIPSSLLQPSKHTEGNTTLGTPSTVSHLVIPTTMQSFTENTTHQLIEAMRTTKKYASKTTLSSVNSTDQEEDTELLRKVKAIAKKFHMEDDIKGLNAEQIRQVIRKELQYIKDEGLENLITQFLSTSDIKTLKEFLKGDIMARHKRDLSEAMLSIKERLRAKFHSMKEKIRNAEQLAFIVLLVVLILGEMLCSPVEKIADDSWFEFLENIDDMEKYGKHRIWSSLAYIIFPIIVTLTVDNTDCLFNMQIHPFMLHFYMFGAFLGLSFVVAFFYPIPPPNKTGYKSKLTKALNLTCCRLGGLLYVVTLLIMGLILSSYTNYLFWLIQDLDGKESTMGMCVLIASLAELPMLFLGGQMVRKLGNGGVVSIALVCLAARTLYYSFIKSPWAVLPAEVTHAFTHTAMWFAILSHRAFQVSPTIDRSIRSVFSSVYFGIGFGVGSMLSGMLYDQYGLSILFRACSILSVGWCPIFFLLNRCCHPVPEKDIKYTRLLQSDDQSDDEYDDWLEHAMKD